MADRVNGAPFKLSGRQRPVAMSRLVRRPAFGERGGEEVGRPAGKKAGEGPFDVLEGEVDETVAAEDEVNDRKGTGDEIELHELRVV